VGSANTLVEAVWSVLTNAPLVFMDFIGETLPAYLIARRDFILWKNLGCVIGVIPNAGHALIKDLRGAPVVQISFFS
jgi:hypothetical protein